jgi:hypothetical protein
MSNLWVTAAHQPDDFISHEDLAQMYSGDYDVPMHRVRHEMRQEWAKDQEPDSDFDTANVHFQHRQHGGPDAYIEHLKKDIAQNGMREPLEIRGGNVVVDGHNRGLAAMDLRMKDIPVRYTR